LRCFSRRSFELWICLEADPFILAFCERPAYVGVDYSRRVADFWVRTPRGDALLVLSDSHQPSDFSAALQVQCIRSADLAAARAWVANWEQMLPTVTTCRRFFSPALLDSIAALIVAPMQLSRIERELRRHDRMLVRAGVFALLQAGRLRAPRLWREPLSYLTTFEPAT
jgi:hypothetical protein